MKRVRRKLNWKSILVYTLTVILFSTLLQVYTMLQVIVSEDNIALHIKRNVNSNTVAQIGNSARPRNYRLNNVSMNKDCEYKMSAENAANFSMYLMGELNDMKRELLGAIKAYSVQNNLEYYSLIRDISVIVGDLKKTTSFLSLKDQMKVMVESKRLIHQGITLIRKLSIISKGEAKQPPGGHAPAPPVKRNGPNVKQVQHQAKYRNRNGEPQKFVEPRKMTYQVRSGAVAARKTKYSKWRVNVTHCLPLKAASPPMPVTALASFPGSGNTWLRHLIQEVTGLMTGSQHADPYLVIGGFPGERYTDGKAVVVKTHNSPGSLRNVKRAIILLRNPYRSLVADYNRHNKVNSNEHTGYAPEKLFHDADWQKQAVTLGPQWYNFYDAWLDLDKPLLVLTYEDLKKDVLFQMKRIIHFLGLNIPEKNYHCMLNNTEGGYHRKPKTVEVNLYSKKQIKFTNFYATMINDRLIKKHNITVNLTVPN